MRSHVVRYVEVDIWQKCSASSRTSTELRFRSLKSITLANSLAKNLRRQKALAEVMQCLISVLFDETYLVRLMRHTLTRHRLFTENEQQRGWITPGTILKGLENSDKTRRKLPGSEIFLYYFA